MGGADGAGLAGVPGRGRGLLARSASSCVAFLRAVAFLRPEAVIPASRSRSRTRFLSASSSDLRRHADGRHLALDLAGHEGAQAVAVVLGPLQQVGGGLGHLLLGGARAQ